MTEVIRDNARNSKLKQGILPALGELLFLVATQEERKGRSVEAWTVPAVTYTIMARCIREGVRLKQLIISLDKKLDHYCFVFWMGGKPISMCCVMHVKQG